MPVPSAQHDPIGPAARCRARCALDSNLREWRSGRRFKRPIVGAARRSMMPVGRCHNRSTTSGPAAARTSGRAAARCRAAPSPAQTADRGWRGADCLHRLKFGLTRRRRMSISAATPPRAHVPAPSDIRRKRLLFRSWHRGTRESRFDPRPFAEAHLAGFDAASSTATRRCSNAPMPICSTGSPAAPPPPPEHDHDVTPPCCSPFRYTPTPPRMSARRDSLAGGSQLTPTPSGLALSRPARASPPLGRRVAAT